MTAKNQDQSGQTPSYLKLNAIDPRRLIDNSDVKKFFMAGLSLLNKYKRLKIKSNVKDSNLIF